MTSARLASIDWTGVIAGLDTSGWAPLGSLLTADECDTLAAGLVSDVGLRWWFVLPRLGFGRGE